jgi:alanine racemase
MQRRTLLTRFAAGLAALLIMPRRAWSSVGRVYVEKADFGPRLFITRTALLHNVHEIARVTANRPILAVVKNNAYGLGLTAVGPILDSAREVQMLAVVKPDEARELRAAGVRKPILLMAAADPREAIELVRAGVQLTPFHDTAPRDLSAIAQGVQRDVPVHLYIDTGMNRLGIPYYRAFEWARALSATKGVRIVGTFMTFTENETFDAEQLTRFTTLVQQLRAVGVGPGIAHAASSFALFFRPDSYLDAVRPGLALYGAYPAGARTRDVAQLQLAFSLRARVARVERLRPGDSVSYGRNYIADRPVWVATIPVGHADGYPRAAVKGCEILIGNRLYRVIGAVSASHCIVEVGDEPTVAVGDEAELIGSGSPAVHPNTIAERAGISVYDVLMHLSAKLPGTVHG